MKVHHWKTIIAVAVAVAASLTLATGAAPSQAATLVGRTNSGASLSASDLAKLPLTTADFWYLHNRKVEKFDCHISFTTLFAQLGVLPDYVSAVGASAPKGN